MRFKLAQALPFALALTLSGSAFASVIQIERTETRNGEWLFKKDGPQYPIIENHTTAEGTYFIQSEKQKEEIPFKKMDKDIPGQSSPGHAWMNLEQADGKFFLDYDLELISGVPSDSSEPHSFKSKEKIELKLAQGTWKDYLAGKTITLKANKEGKEAYLRGRRALIQPSLDYATRLGREHFQEAKVGTPSVKLEFAKVTGDKEAGVYVEASLNEMKVTVTPVSSTIKNTITLKEGLKEEQEKQEFVRVVQGLKTQLKSIELSIVESDPK